MAVQDCLVQSLYRLFTMQREVSAVYKTIRNAAQDEFVEKRSRFIGHALPVKTEEEALAFIAEMKSKYWDASHNVYAYILREGGIQRFSDDGEPQGTAGIPTLDVLRKEGLTDLVVVVTRYFGGILLGGGGLVRAYSHGAKIAVDAAGIMQMREGYIVKLQFDYSLYGKITYMIPNYHVQIQDTDFGADITMRFLIAAELYEKFEKELTDLTNAAIVPEIEEKKFADIPLD